MYLMQNWFHLSEEGIEDAIYDSYAMRRVAMMLKAIHAQESKKAAREKARQVAEELREMKLGKLIFADVTNRMNKQGNGGAILATLLLLLQAGPHHARRQNR